MVQTAITLRWLLEGFKYDLQSTLNPQTVDYYCRHLRRFLRWAEAAGVAGEVSLLDKRHILAFFYALLQETEVPFGSSGAKRKVIRTEESRWPYYRALRRLFNWCIEEGYLEHSPMAQIQIKAPRNRPIEPWRSEHIEAMFRVLGNDWKAAKTPRQRMLAARDDAIVSLFLESFVRLQELADLKADDVNVEKQCLLVRRGKMGKGRWAGFGPKTRKALWRYLGLRQPLAKGDGFWLTEEGMPLRSCGIQEIFRRLKRDAGLGQIRGSVHKMRHTGATITLKHTRDMKGLKLLLGHSTLAMTERYTQFIDTEDALKAYEGQGPLDWMNG